MRFLLPQGIGDSIWGLLKVQDVALQMGYKDNIEIFLSCSETTPVQARALEVIRRFSFVKRAEMLIYSIHPPIYPPVDSDGRYIYIPDGMLGPIDKGYFVMMPNSALERGIRLENWLLEYKANWDIMKSFEFLPKELSQAEDLKKEVGINYCVFYLGSMASNTTDGHNRNSIWKPEDWAELGRRITSMGIRIVVVGASYDQTYWLGRVAPLVEDQNWIDLVGMTEIAQVFAFIKNARFVVSFQSGIGIMAEYLGVPTAIFWRQKGDSISPYFYLSFEESMNGAWSPPKMLEAGKHMALYYGRHDPEYIFEMIKGQGW